MKIKNLKVTKHMKAIVLLSLGLTTAIASCKQTTSMLVDGAKIIRIEDMDLEVANKEEIDDRNDQVEEEINPYDLIDLSDYDGNSLATALKKAGYDYSFEARKKLAEHYGIQDYRGTAEQNKALLDKLRVPVEERNIAKNPSNKDADKQDSNKNKTNENEETTKKTNSGNTQNESSESNQTTGESDGNNESHEKEDEPSKGDTHYCNFGSWYSKNDQLEARKCSCGKEETRAHKYTEVPGSCTPAGDGKHAIKSQKTCVNCGHSIQSQTTENCSYDQLFSIDPANETWKCKCGQTKIVGHNPASKTEQQADGSWLDVTYCTNGCGWSTSTGHSHDLEYGAWTSVKEEGVCQKRSVSCKECGYSDEEIDDSHSWTTIQEANEWGDPAIEECDDCHLKRSDGQYFASMLQVYANQIAKNSNVKIKVIGRC